MQLSPDFLIWTIAAGSIAGILFRPGDWPEAIWACTGAVLLVVFRLLTPLRAAEAIAKGTDVYLFLTGMMLLAELARREGVFDWVAGLALNAAKASGKRLFLLIYLTGVLVTTFLSNDATAVVLTPAIYAIVKTARAPAQPYLFACAFIANAASFVLPVSNPANLVVYGKSLPPLMAWLRVFTLPSLLAITATFFALRIYCREDLEGNIETQKDRPELTPQGLRALLGIVVTGAILITASAFGLDLGLPTCLAALCAVLIATHKVMRILRGVSWSVLPLVAGLFILVEGMNQAGANQLLSTALRQVTSLPVWQGALAASFGVAFLCNLMNNLPAGLVVGSTLQSVHASRQIRDAILLGVDLGPNLSLTGSLATVLWLISIRREGGTISYWQFLKAGVLVMTPALSLASLALLY